jgi:hypothetical protein
MGTSIDTTLSVDRDEFTAALRLVSQQCGRRARAASLRFEDGALFICADNAMASLPAKGSWPWTVVTKYAWVYLLAKKPLKSNPLRIYVENARVYVERFSSPCELPGVDAPLEPAIPAINRKLAAARAARFLAPLLVSLDDINEVIDGAASRTPAWREDDRKVIVRVAKAWEALAPLGVHPDDFQKVIQRASSNAWDTMTLRHNSHQRYLDEERKRRAKKT